MKMKSTRPDSSRIAAIALVFVGWVNGALASPPPSTEIPDLIEKIQPTVVNVSSTTVLSYDVGGWQDFLQFWGMPRERKHTSLGSGVILDASGSIVTNHHVVERADEVMVTLLDGRQLATRIVGRDPKLDIALLQVKDPKNLVGAGVGNSDRVRIGESVLAIGNPFGLQHTVTMGIISAKNRTIGHGPLDNFLQTDASINPGNSGGPLFNLKGEVIGINTLIYSRTGQSGGLGFAIPINEVGAILGDLKKFGRVPRPWLGVLAERMSTQIMVYYKLGRPDGVLIYDLVSGGPAQRAGLRQGDIVVKVDGKAVKAPDELERAIVVKKPGSQMGLSIQRGKRMLDLQLSLEELPRKINELPQGIL